MTKQQYTQFKEFIFDIMSGETDIKCLGISNEYQDGAECEELYEELYSLVEKISILPKYEKDMERIQECHYNILKFFSMKMFDYGWKFAMNYASTERV